MCVSRAACKLLQAGVRVPPPLKSFQESTFGIHLFVTCLSGFSRAAIGTTTANPGCSCTACDMPNYLTKWLGNENEIYIIMGKNRRANSSTRHLIYFRHLPKLDPDNLRAGINAGKRASGMGKFVSGVIVDRWCMELGRKLVTLGDEVQDPHPPHPGKMLKLSIAAEVPLLPDEGKNTLSHPCNVAGVSQG